MPTSTLQQAQRFTLSSANTQRTYELSVMPPLPSPATGARPNDCPIFIVLDAPLAFGTCVERSSMYAALGALEPSVIVGIGYPVDVITSLRYRTFDFTPETPAEAHADLHALMGNHFGGANAFLAFILDELTAAVAARVPEASTSRLMLHGFSLGGLFTAHALLKRPDAFETISSISPSLWWSDFQIFQHIPQFSRKLQSLVRKPKVLIGVGGLEQDEPTYAPPGVSLDALKARVRSARMVDGACDFAAGIRDAGISDVQLAVFDGENHAGALTAGSGRAVSFALTPD